MANKNQHHKPGWTRPVILIATLGLIGGGLLLLARAYFISYPPRYFEADTLEQSTNLPLTIQGVNTSLAPGGGAWGEQIVNTFAYPNSSLWVVVKQPNQSVIGKVDAQEFEVKFSLPTTAEQVRLYQDESVAYVVPSNNLVNARLVTINASQGSQVITEAPAGWEISSFIFSSNSKNFYYALAPSLGSTNSGVRLVRATPGRPTLELYRLNIEQYAELRGIDDNDSSLKLALGKTLDTCANLILETKVLESAYCETYPQAGTTTNLLVNRQEGIILRIDTSTGTDTPLLTLNSSQILLAAVRDAYIALVEVGQDSSSSTILLYGLATNSSAQLQAQLSLPPNSIISNITQLGLYNGANIAVVMVDTQNGQQLLVARDQHPDQELDEQWQQVLVPGCGKDCQFKIINLQQVIYASESQNN